jgi:hypothetical protein
MPKHPAFSFFFLHPRLAATAAAAVAFAFLAAALVAAPTATAERAAVAPHVFVPTTVAIDAPVEEPPSTF